MVSRTDSPIFFLFFFFPFFFLKKINRLILHTKPPDFNYRLIFDTRLILATA